MVLLRNNTKMKQKLMKNISVPPERYTKQKRFSSPTFGAFPRYCHASVTFHVTRWMRMSPTPMYLKVGVSQEVSDLWIVEIVPTTTHPPKKGKCLAQANSGDQRHHILCFRYLRATRRAQTASGYVLRRVSRDVSANPTSRPTLQPCKHHIARTYI
jgi:hypothetical protein